MCYQDQHGYISASTPLHPKAHSLPLPVAKREEPEKAWALPPSSSASATRPSPKQSVRAATQEICWSYTGLLAVGGLWLASCLFAVPFVNKTDLSTQGSISHAQNLGRFGKFVLQNGQNTDHSAKQLHLTGLCWSAVTHICYLLQLGETVKPINRWWKDVIRKTWNTTEKEMY